MVSYSPAQATITNCNQVNDQAVFEADKRSVYKHPLFPLLALIFERCEQATQCSEIPNSEGFTSDIREFVQHQQKDDNPILTNDDEVDGLMIKAIQVLRIHLLELEKVQELCKDFCTRYITCLKNKMQSENLLKPDYSKSYSENNSTSGHSSASNSPHPYSPRPLQTSSETAFNETIINSNYSQTSPAEIASSINSGPNSSCQVLSINCNLNSNETSASSPGVILGSTPLSQIGAQSMSSMGDAVHDSLSPTSVTSCDDIEDHLGNRRKQKRGVLPKHATSIMRAWLFQHLVHPYPTEDEKKHIAAQTNLTLLQVNNWFINARRRILQPMLDASAIDTKGPQSLATDEESDSEGSENEFRIDETAQPENSDDEEIN